MPSISSLNASSAPHTELVSHPPAQQNLRRHCENALNQIKSPELARYLPAGIGLPAERHLAAVQTFQNSPEFSAFKRSVLDCLEYLDHSSTTTAEPFSSSKWGYFAQRLGLEVGEGNNSPFDVDLYELYDVSCSNLRRIEKMLTLVEKHQAQFPGGTRAEILQQIKLLSQDLAVCGPGVTKNIQQAHDRITDIVIPPNLSAKYTADRILIARQMFRAFANQHLRDRRYFTNNEIHIAGAIQNHFARDFELPIEDDRYASTTYVKDCEPHLEKFKQRLKRELSVDAVAKHMAVQLLNHLQSRIKTPDTNDSKRASFFTQLTSALAALRDTHGEFNANHICELDDECQPSSITQNPTLLALSLINKLPEQTKAQFSPTREPLKAGSNSNDHLCLGEKLTWIERRNNWGTEQRTVELDDLENKQILSLMANNDKAELALRAMYEALKNATPPIPIINRNVDYHDRPAGERAAAMFVAIFAMPEHTPGLLQAQRFLSELIKPEDWASFLLNAEPSALTPSQIRNIIIGNKLLGVAIDTDTGKEPFRKFVLELKGGGGSEHPKCSPELLRVVLDLTQVTEQESIDLRDALLEQTDTRYLDVAIQRFPNKELFEPMSLLTAGLLGKKLHSSTCHYLTKKVEGPLEATHFALNPLALLPGSGLADSDCARATRMLLSKGTNFAPDSFAFWDPLRQAISNGKTETTRVLIEHPDLKIGPEELNLCWPSYFELLNRRLEPEVACNTLNLLIEKGIDTHSKRHGETPLLTSLGYRNPGVVRRLLEAGANAFTTDSAGENALHKAVFAGSHTAEIVQILLQHGVPAIPNINGKTPLQLALEMGHFEVAKVLQENQGNINGLNQDGYTPLQTAILKAAGLFNADQRAYKVEVLRIQVLLAAGADPNAKSSWAHRGKRPLHFAHKYNLLEIVEILRNRGASEALRDDKFRRPALMQPR